MIILIMLASTKVNIHAVLQNQAGSIVSHSQKGQRTQEVAAVQTNGTIAVQMLPELNDKQKDVVAIGAVASALSWRPEE